MKNIWTKEKIWEWYNKQPWIVGFNYVPSNAVNSTEMWQKEVFDQSLIRRELRTAADIGYNTCRVFLQYLLWKDCKEELFTCFDTFLNISEDCGIRVIPILFDDCAFDGREPYLGKQDEPVKGIHNSRWTPSPGFGNADSEKEQELLKRYVTDFVERYGQDERIVLWDLYNEPGNSDRKGRSVKLLRDVFSWARSCDPSQPLTSGIFVFEDFDMVCGELSDLISFHDYSPISVTEENVKVLQGYERPMVCTEWLHRPNGNCIESHMPFYKEKRIGIVNWGLVAGKTQTYLNWDASRNPKEGMPEIWQHDILDGDLNPYSKEEVALITSVIGK